MATSHTGYRLICLLLLIGVSGASRRCSETEARYRLTFEGLWSEEAFPKQYPKVRPPAHWSRLIGRSHSSSYSLWREGSQASAAVKELAELGTTVELERTEAQGWNGLLDVFASAALPAGTARSAVDFVADSNHSRLSAVAKIVPSPDWFVGLDSVHLCVDGHWAPDLSFDLQPHDAGTDQGFTFTSPNWASQPPQKVFRITASFPSHRASSFHYPDRQALPPVARARLQLLSVRGPAKAYAAVSHRRDSEAQSAEELRASEEELERLEAQMIVAGEPVPLLTAKPKPAVRAPSRRTHVAAPAARPQSQRTPAPTPAPQTSERRKPEWVLASRKSPGRKSSARHLVSASSLSGRASSPERRPARRDCSVGEWGEWTECSKSCGFGVQKRVRKVVEEAERGRPCPALQQEKWCGSMRTCSEQRSVFSWLKKPARRVHRRRRVHRKRHLHAL